MDNEDKQRAHQIMADLNIEAGAALAAMSGGERRRCGGACHGAATRYSAVG